MKAARAPRPLPVTAASDFSTAVLPHRAELLRAALRYTKSPADADDLLQDTMARALNSWHGYQPNNARGWLHAILLNTFRSSYRQRQRHRERESDARDALYPEAESQEHDSPIGDEVKAALTELSPDHRQVIELADLQGMAYLEIAALLELPMGTVMTRLHRARRRLAVTLTDYALTYGIRQSATRLKRLRRSTP